MYRVYCTKYGKYNIIGIGSWVKEGKAWKGFSILKKSRLLYGGN